MFQNMWIHVRNEDTFGIRENTLGLSRTLSKQIEIVHYLLLLFLDSKYLILPLYDVKP